MPLSFEAFHHCLTGQTPFRWQVRFAAELDVGHWPTQVALPTATGKTSLFEIWLYALARERLQGVQPRRVPLRLLWVVDRRIVVDEVAMRGHDAAAILHTALQQPEHPLSAYAHALCPDADHVLPLHVAQLRGGIAGQRQWVTAPHQPTLVATTVDQIGSRLLFRGYGVSPYQASVEAGLVATDTLIVIDEAHLSQPFVATLGAVQRRLMQSPIAVGLPLQMIVVSATLPAEEVGTRFTLTTDEREELAPRLARPKWTTLVKGDRSPERVVAEAHRLQAETQAEVTGVIVNRVDRARAVFTLLAKDTEVVLLTGRVRPYDRDRLLKEWLPRLKVGRTPDPASPPCYVVATQTIEVGANVDFDALVTDMAFFSALRQRFGRENRVGARTHAAAVILAPDKAEGVYPFAVVQGVWDWLHAHAQPGTDGHGPLIDMADEALMRFLAVGDVPPEGPVVQAPILTTAHLEHWTQTAPAPALDPDIVPFLHGKVPHMAADVLLVWRADLRQSDLQDIPDESVGRDALAARWRLQLGLTPPRTEEALALPLWTARAWLLGEHDTAPIADIEGTGGAERPETSIRGHFVLRWDGHDVTVMTPLQLRPGDTVILPATRGGCDRFGWNPESTEPVRDLGGLAGRQGRRRQYLRLHPLLWPSLLATESDPVFWQQELRVVLEAIANTTWGEEATAETVIDRFVRELVSHVAFDVQEVLLSWLATPGRSWALSTTSSSAPDGIILEWFLLQVSPSATVDGDDAAADQSSMMGLGRRKSRAVPLREHNAAVGACVMSWATQLQLPPALVQTLTWAGRFHDLGKAERRFQVMLHRGDVLAAAAAPEAIAKSGMDPRDQQAQQRARSLAQVPSNFRHEALSARLLLNAGTNLPECDHDLLCYLVGTHHGRGRPWFPVVADPAPTQVATQAVGYTFSASSATDLERVDAGWPDRFARLQERYGMWGLAYVEALLRMADRWVSSQEEHG